MVRKHNKRRRVWQSEYRERPTARESHAIPIDTVYIHGALSPPPPLQVHTAGTENNLCRLHSILLFLVR